MAVVACAVSACSTAADDGALVGAQPADEPTIYVLPPPSIDPDSLPESEIVHAASFTRRPDGVVLPDREITPGAAFPDVDQTDVCDLHYTQGVRQPSYNAKVAAFANYGVSIRDRDIYQVDHLIPLSLGGNNTEANLWPLAYDGSLGAADKDLLERQLRGLVCSGTLTLREAQEAIATDWGAAYVTYMHVPIEPGSDGLPVPTISVPDPTVVAKGGPCDQEGAVAYTEPKHVRLTCTMSSDDTLRWQRRS